MTIDTIALSNTHLSLWADGQKGLVLHHSLKQLFMLEPLPLALLLALDSDVSIDDAVAQLTQLSHVPTEQIVPLVEPVKQLLCPKSNSSSYAEGRYPELKPHSVQPLLGSALVVRVASSTFAIRCQHRVLSAALSDLLAPIAIEQTQYPDTVDFMISVLESEAGSFYMQSNGVEVAKCLPLEQVTPLLIDRLQILSYQKSDYRFAFHGAALTSTRHRIPHRLLLPGSSGAGKSTLAAELSHCGYQLYSDEIITLNSHMESLCLRLPIAIKSGSWHLFGENYPELNEQTESHRLDGRRLKYIWPKEFADQNREPDGFQPEKEAMTLLAIPRFEKDATPSWRKLSVIDTITLLTEGGYQLGVELSEPWVEALIAFCQSVSAYQINYGNSEQAIRLLDELLEHP